MNYIISILLKIFLIKIFLLQILQAQAFPFENKNSVVKDVNQLMNRPMNSTFYSNAENKQDKIFRIGQSIMCKSGKYGLTLTKDGFKYLKADKHNKFEEIPFTGEVDNYKMTNSHITNAYFDKDSNFVLNYANRSFFILVNYVNKFDRYHYKKDVRITCNNKNGRIQFYEMYYNRKKVYYEFPDPSLTKPLK